MLVRQGNATRKSVLSDKERSALLRIARVSLPAGKLFAGAGDECVAKVDNFLALSGPAVLKGYLALLWSLEAGARLAHRRPFAELSDEQLLALLESWRGADYARRTLVRMLTLPLKLAHFNDPEKFAAVHCRFGTPPVATVEKQRFMDRVTVAEDLPPAEEIECDAVVIGTGAGGAVVAKELAERGLAVVLLEEGRFFTRKDFTGHGIDMQRKLYRDGGATISVGNVSIPIPIGKSVGGTTTINSGTCYRAPARVFRKWQEKLGLAGYSPESMIPYYEKVEQVLDVHAGEWKFLGGVARVVARGCDHLGYKHAAIPRNARECDGQGVCCFGCPTDAKRSTNVSYVPMALKAGAMLFAGVKAEEILVENGHAAGVRARARIGNSLRTLTVRARAVVVACGSLLTPLLLEKNGIGMSSGQLGRNLSIHPACGVMGIYDEILDGQSYIPQGYAVEEFHDEGLLFEGAFAPLDVGAASLPLIGEKLIGALEQYRHLAAFGFMVEDTSRGRVRPGPGGRPIITYWLNKHDTARIKRGVEILARIFFAGGAHTVLPLVNGFDELKNQADLARFRRASLGPRDFEITAYHPLGTTRMGADPGSSVIGPDFQVHDTPGVYVTDGAAVPTSPAVNPQLTIMAMATRASEILADRLS